VPTLPDMGHDVDRGCQRETPLWFAMDGGGNTTRLGTISGAVRRELEFGSINPSSVGELNAERNLLRVFEFVAGEAQARPVSGFVASSTIEGSTIEGESRRLRRAAVSVGLQGQMVVANDVVPLIYGPPLNGHGVAAIVGTGSGFAGRSGDGRLARAGGYEYVISDEGSAMALGLAGLRAAAWAQDGRGPSTVLLKLAEDHFDGSIAVIGRQLARQGSPKQLLARFAPDVCFAWCGGDSVAGRIVERAINDVLEGIAAVRRALAPDPMDQLLLNGGVLEGCKPFREAVSVAAQSSGVSACHPVASGLAAALSIAQSPGRLPFSERVAWPAIEVSLQQEDL